MTRYLVQYRDRQAARAAICFVGGMILFGGGSLLVVAAWAEREPSMLAGVPLALGGVLFLIAGFRLLYLRAHPPSAEQGLSGYVRRQVTVGVIGLAMAVTIATGLVLTAPVDPVMLLYFVFLVGLAALGVHHIVRPVRRARRLRRLAAASTGRRVRVLAFVTEERSYGRRVGPAVVVDAPDGPLLVPLVRPPHPYTFADEDGCVTVGGELRPGETVVLVQRDGEPAWPAGPAVAEPYAQWSGAWVGPGGGRLPHHGPGVHR